MTPAQQTVTRPASTPPLVLASTGVETELFAPVPRRVVPSDEIKQWRVWGINLLAGCFLFALFLLRTNAADYSGIACLVTFFGIGVMCGWIVAEGRARDEHRLLRDGYAMRATVDRCITTDNCDPPRYDIYYSYAGRSGHRLTAFLLIDADTVKRVGGFAVGTSFTVLSHPDAPQIGVPYLQVRYATLPGAAPVRTTGG